ncbi:multivesicular body subunit 12A [Electrophorus electricus]|uniref:Multivesicular body subunit 12A n=1 Tax=Electrophorus electricus TaxID=8005 RepID=A0A4W4H423_ELEEL|nr:multivesicular body subunit 12A [Electrophorus electricus]
MSSTSFRPITAVAWTSSGTTCPGHFTLISVTEDGATASFTRGFGLKSGYYLCCSKDLSGGMVVSDVQVISDKETLPHGYCYIPEYMDSKVSVWKKKRVCVRIVPVDSVTTAVLDIRITAKSKMMLQQYTCLGDMLGYVLWCMKGPFSIPVPQAKPRRISLDIGKMSLDGAAPPLPLRPSNQPAAPPRLSRRHSNLDVKESPERVCDGTNIHGITAMDGVPFALHPKFEARASETVSMTLLDDIRIKSVQDIENEYNYTFAVEELAAKRSCPSVTSLT